MVHLEFGQDRLIEPHPLNTFELAQGAIKIRSRPQIHHVPGKVHDVHDVHTVYPTE